MTYTSIHNDKIKLLKSLHTKKSIDETNLFLVEGEHLVNEAQKSGFLKEVILLENKSFNFENKIYVNEKVMKYISMLESIPNIMGVCYKKKEEIKGDKILILDSIQDPGNLGTIIRSAVAFNIDTIILSKTCVSLYNQKVIRASQGMIFKMNFAICDLEKIVKNLKESGYKIWSTNVSFGKSIKKVEKIKKFAIIMGNEGNGVSSNLQKLSDENLYIDMNESCESLNVAVATSIILYELNR